MDVTNAVQLAESGNVRNVEAEWLNLVESESTSPVDLIDAKGVLEALAQQSRLSEADSLAWAAIETVQGRFGIEDTLRVAKEFLLVLHTSEDLRRQVTNLYQEVYADRDGIAELVEASGIAGGRPPRRAIRTLDVCLAVKPGSFAVARHEDAAARVESIDTSTWNVTFVSGGDTDSAEPVEFADHWAPVAEDDFNVLRHCDKKRLKSMLEDDPARIVMDILQAHNDKIDSDDLKKLLTRDALAPSAWSKWWTKARTALKRAPHVRIEGRSPYVLTYDHAGTTVDEQFETDFARHRDPQDRLAALETYLRECRNHKSEPDRKMLSRLGAKADEQAEKGARRHNAYSFAEHLVAWRYRQAAGDEQGDEAVVAFLDATENAKQLFKGLDSAPSWTIAFDLLAEHRPDQWLELAVELFPLAPAAACDDLAARMEKASVGPERILQIMSAIMADAENSADALCWLWDRGGARPAWSESASPVTVLTRLIKLLADIRQNPALPADVERHIRTVVRSTLSARKYERFLACIAEIDAGVGQALHTQIQRLDNLGAKVQEDLRGRIRARFPKLAAKPQIPPWAMEDVLFATSEGINRWREDIEELVNVKMKENARAIGAAAEKGDLSENSEYKFALEERDLLRARLANMQQQLALAKPLDFKEVPTDHVNVGAKVRFEQVDSGREFTVTLLGPFEANADARIYNYKAPFAQDLMGKRVGEEVNIAVGDAPGVYRITSISPWRD